MKGDITIYINPCSTGDYKHYNGIVLKVMEESKLKYSIQTPSNRLHGLIKIDVVLEDEKPEQYSTIVNDLRAKLESHNIEVKRILDFRGRSL